MVELFFSAMVVLSFAVVDLVAVTLLWVVYRLDGGRLDYISYLHRML